MPDPTAAHRTDTPSPAPIVHAAAGFMAAKQLFVASRIGLFEALAGEPLPAGELAGRLGLPERSVRIVADAMAGLGLLVAEDGRYRNGEATATYLSGQAGTLDLRPFLAFWDALSYPHWRAYEQAVRQAAPAKLDLEGTREATFFAGVGAFNTAHALMLAGVYDFRAHRRVLDLDGLSPAFLTCAMDRNPDLRGTFFAGKDLLEMARAGVAGSPAADRIELVAGDPLADELPTGFDAVLLEHSVHRHDAATNRTLLTRARGTVEPGATLLVVDFFLDEDGAARSLDALMAGEYLVVDGTVVYPEAEVRGWVEDTGWRWRETRQLPGSPRVLLADAV